MSVAASEARASRAAELERGGCGLRHWQTDSERDIDRQTERLCGSDPRVFLDGADQSNPLLQLLGCVSDLSRQRDRLPLPVQPQALHKPDLSDQRFASAKSSRRCEVLVSPPIAALTSEEVPALASLARRGFLWGGSSSLSLLTVLGLGFDITKPPVRELRNLRTGTRSARKASKPSAQHDLFHSNCNFE